MAFTVALQTDFLSSYARLPRAAQAKASSFIVRFMNDPCALGIDYEGIEGAAAALQTVRIDEDLCGVVVRDDAAGVCLLLWVDRPDEARAWARRKRVAVNPASGALQVYEPIATQERDESSSAAVCPFAALSDEDLRCLCVPDDLVEAVRAMSAEAFRLAGGSLPADAFENLTWIAEGFPVEEVLDLVRAERDEGPVDTSLAASLENPQTLRSFTVVEGEDELYAMLSAPLEKWRVFLHPLQRKAVTRTYRGSARVLGGAGTGKTVVAMHRAKALAAKLGPGERLLFTTYSNSLALDISNNLTGICSKDVMARIEVTNLDAWVAHFLREQGFEFTIVYDEGVLEDLWEEALLQADVNLSYEPAFFREEWSRVVMAQDVVDAEGYAQARRAGRGTRLGRRERRLVWKVCEAYRRLMKLRGVRDVDAAMNECRLFIAQMPEPPRYRHVVVDEGQDFSAPAYRLLRQLAGPEHENDLFIVGDARQRIYGRKVVLSRCGINVRGRSSTLRINYRTTEEIRRCATRILEGIAFDDLDGQPQDDARTQSLSHGAAPRFEACASAEDERDLVVARVAQLVGAGVEPSEICVAARTNSLVDTFAMTLKAAGMDVFVLRERKFDDRSKPGVRVATMHRVKGLEFGYVLLPGLSEQQIPPAAARHRAMREGREEELLLEERSLLYVAMTRARREVFASFSGAPSSLLGLQDDLL